MYKLLEKVTKDMIILREGSRMKLIKRRVISGFRVCYFNDFIEKNQNKTHFEEGFSSYTSLRGGSGHQNVDPYYPPLRMVLG